MIDKHCPLNHINNKECAENCKSSCVLWLNTLIINGILRCIKCDKVVKEVGNDELLVARLRCNNCKTYYDTVLVGGKLYKFKECLKSHIENARERKSENTKERA